MNKLFLNIALIATFGITSMHATKVDGKHSFFETAKNYANITKKNFWMLGSLASGAIFVNQYLNTTRIAGMLDSTFKHAENKYTKKLMAMLPRSIDLKNNRVAQVALLLGTTYVGYTILKARCTTLVITPMHTMGLKKKIYDSIAKIDADSKRLLKKLELIKRVNAVKSEVNSIENKAKEGHLITSADRKRGGQLMVEIEELENKIKNLEQ